jgi:hypothetical protein
LAVSGATDGRLRERNWMMTSGKTTARSERDLGDGAKAIDVITVSAALGPDVERRRLWMGRASPAFSFDIEPSAASLPLHANEARASRPPGR